MNKVTVGLVAVLLAGCGSQAGVQDLVASFDEAGVPLEERKLNDGSIVWSSNTDENVLIEVVGDPVESVFLFMPALSGEVGESFAGSRYVQVVDDTLAPRLMEWIIEEAAGRSSGDWSATRDFGSTTVEIDNDPTTLRAFTVSLSTEHDKAD